MLRVSSELVNTLYKLEFKIYVIYLAAELYGRSFGNFWLKTIDLQFCNC